LNNIAILGLGISVLWLFALGFYFYVSRQQNNILNEIDELSQKLDEVEEDPTRPAN
jgi:hypothetical protein